MKARSSKAAFDELKRFGAMIPSVLAVFADIQEVGSIQEVAERAEKQRDQMNVELATAASQRDKIKAESKSLQSALDISLAEKTVAYDLIIAGKNTEAASTIEAAKSQADFIISGARAEAGNIVGEAKSAASVITDGIAESKTKLKFLNADIAEAEKKLAGLQASVVDIEASKRSLMEKLG